MTDKRNTLELVEEHERLQFELPDAQEDRRIVTRKGRILADGSRTAAPPRIRLTVYLEPDLGRRLDVYAASHGRERSGVLGEALAAWLASREASS
jgi:hypothetical protein